MACDDSIVVDGDAAAFLSSVLQCIKARINAIYHIAAVAANTENSAFLVKTIFYMVHFVSSIYVLQKFSYELPAPPSVQKTDLCVDC